MITIKKTKPVSKIQKGTGIYSLVSELTDKSMISLDDAFKGLYLRLTTVPNKKTSADKLLLFKSRNYYYKKESIYIKIPGKPPIIKPINENI